MKKILFLLLIVFLTVVPQTSAQQSIQLTTYYPAPYGAYQQIRVGDNVLITPQDSKGGACDNGQIYVSSTEGTQLCQGNVWVPVGGWSTNGKNVFNNEDDVRIGIGTSNPQTELHLQGNTPAIRAEDDGGLICTFEANDTEAVIGTTSASNLNIVTSNTPHIIVRDNGNVGIGEDITAGQITQPLTVTPNLFVTATDAGNPAWITVSNNASPAQNYVLGIDTNGDFLLQPGSQPNPLGSYLKMAPDGNVVISGTLSIDDASSAVKVKLYDTTDETRGYYATYAP